MRLICSGAVHVIDSMGWPGYRHPVSDSARPDQPSPALSLANAASLIRLSNQTGTVLLALPSLWALVLASEGRPSVRLCLVFLAGAFIMRSAGVIMNDLADRSLDRRVSRTRTRPLASGALSPVHAVLLLGILLLFAVGLLTFLNPLTVQLGPVALGLAAMYPFTKRFFPVPQLFLGLAFGWGTVMAWAAVREQLDPVAWLLFAATICWAVAYDTIYALQDREDDRRIGIHSSALCLDSHVWVAVGVIEVVMLGLLATAGWLTHLNGAFYGMLAGVAGFMSQQVWRLRGVVTPTEAFAMFQHHVGIGLAILGGLWLGRI